MPIVSLVDVSKVYRQHGTSFRALDAVNLSVEKGVIQGIIGFSGAGKSTLLRCITRLEQPDTGQVFVDGSDLASLKGHNLRVALRKIGVVFQQFHLLRSRTVAGNIALPLELAGESDTAITARVRELLQYFGLEGKADSYPSQLSGGQRQRVAIARALATKPAVLLSDEPTSALDPETTASVLALLRRVRDELGVTIILITHQLSAIRSICDRVAVLDHGAIVEEGRVEDVLLRPSSQATQRLLGNNMHIAQLADYLGDRTAHKGSVFLELQLLGKSTTEPLLSDVTRTLDVTVSILRAEIGELSGSAYGLLLVELSGTPQALDQAQHLLTNRGAIVTSIDPWEAVPVEQTA